MASGPTLNLTFSPGRALPPTPAGMSIRRSLCFVIACCALAAVLLRPSPTQADAVPRRATLIVQFDGSQSETRCVGFVEDRLTGLELLRRGGWEVVTWGSAVCRIGEIGCSYPAERCFCQCLAPPCSFWSYWQWREGRWQYSQVGASQRLVADGDVDAWVWGDGQTPPALAPDAALCPHGSGVLAPVPAVPGDAIAEPPPLDRPIWRSYLLLIPFALALLGLLAWTATADTSTTPVGLHSLAWVSWLVAAAYVSLVNQQPLQSGLMILAVAAVFTRLSRGHPRSQGWRAFLRLGLWMWVVALAFHLLSTHVGDYVLITLPDNWPIIGGAITLEALFYGLASGAGLFAVLLVFATFNLAVETYRLLRWVPAGLYQAGLIVTIAVAFVPQMMASLQDIREAQQVRGHAFRGLRDWIPLFVPLLTTALERSLTLAESLEARGFGASYARSEARHNRSAEYVALGGMLALCAGLLWPVLGLTPGWLAGVLAGLGAAGTLWSIRDRGRGLARTHYQQERWGAGDTFVAVASACALCLTAAVHLTSGLRLVYYPYPPQSPWPAFELSIALAAVLLAAPALAREVSSPSEARR